MKYSWSAQIILHYTENGEDFYKPIPISGGHEPMSLEEIQNDLNKLPEFVEKLNKNSFPEFAPIFNPPALTLEETEEIFRQEEEFERKMVGKISYL